MEDLLMKKTVVAFLMALSVFSCSSMVSQAAVCGGSTPDGVHHFDAHRLLNAGYSVYKGTHQYLYGYTEDNKPIVRNDCRITWDYEYCENCCIYCNVGQGNTHPELIRVRHSINHN